MYDYRCDKHKIEYKDNHIVSPCRARCRKCKNKRVDGYSNPEHITNPFGYLFLFPYICNKCSNELELCKWCEIE